MKIDRFGARSFDGRLLRKGGWLAAATAVLSLAIPSFALALTPTEIMEQAEKVQKRAQDRKATMVMKTVSKRGDVREKKVATYFKTYGDDTKSILFFLAPPDVKGTSFLQFGYKEKDDEQWIYLPSQGRVRQIVSSEKNQSFMGTDFTYDDMAIRDVSKDEHKLVSEEALDGVPCWKIESKPKDPDEDDSYSRVVTWVRKSDYLPARAEFYDPKGDQLKVLTVKDIFVLSDIPTAKRLEMKNVQKSTSTEISLDQIEYNKGLAEDLFTQRYMQRGEP